MAKLSTRARIVGAANFVSMADGGASVQIARSAGARYDSMVGNRSLAAVRGLSSQATMLNTTEVPDSEYCRSSNLLVG
jgi:hypothetical protein